VMSLLVCIISVGFGYHSFSPWILQYTTNDMMGAGSMINFKQWIHVIACKTGIGFFVTKKVRLFMSFTSIIFLSASGYMQTHKTQ